MGKPVVGWKFQGLGELGTQTDRLSFLENWYFNSFSWWRGDSAGNTIEENSSVFFLIWVCLLHFAWVVDDAKCIVVTRVCVSVCLSVCLSAAVCPDYCTDPDVTWRHGRGCPLVVHNWANLQSGHGLHCYGNITQSLVTSLHPSHDMTT